MTVLNDQGARRVWRIAGLCKGLPDAPSVRRAFGGFFGNRGADLATKDDEAAQIDLRAMQVGDVADSVAVFPSDKRFITAWRCPACQRRQGCSYQTETHDEAVKCAEAEVLTHHAKYHREHLPSGDV